MRYYLVLGNKSKNNTPSSDMYSRVRYFYNMVYNTSDNITVIFSGADDEARLMEKIFKSMCYPDFLEQCSIIIDNDARNTIDSIKFIRRYGVSGVTVITSDYHAPRVRLITKKLHKYCTVVEAPTVSGIMWKVLLEMLFYIVTFIFPISICEKFSKLRRYLHLK